MPFATSIALAVSLALSGSAAEAPKAVAVMPAAQTVEEYVREYFADEPILIEIARCESQFRQFGANGKVLKNPNSTAMGVMQIMASIHTKPADNLGLDILTIDGNLEYARHLYEEQGVKPWAASGACWKKSTAYKQYTKELAVNI